jgi:hypothetical protein
LLVGHVCYSRPYRRRIRLNITVINSDISNRNSIAEFYSNQIPSLEKPLVKVPLRADPISDFRLAGVDCVAFAQTFPRGLVIYEAGLEAQSSVARPCMGWNHIARRGLAVGSRAPRSHASFGNVRFGSLADAHQSAHR